ncbi:MAG: TlpA disulfide reductase family protein [Acidobacteriota bacterium]|nr:TlpA disulfide reductase family protein [Acidobacteriota bacterium]
MIRTYWKTILSITLLLALGATLSSCSAGKRSVENLTAGNAISASGRVGTAPGDTAPDFQLAKMDGALVSTSNLRGQPAVIVFWTAWCLVCKEETPRINALAAQYESKGVRVLGINIKDSPARTEGGINEFGIKYAIARDADASVARSYKVAGTPTILFLDRKGVVRYFANELPDDYTQRLDVLLADNG